MPQKRTTDRRLRIVISLADRQLWALIGADTLLSAPIAVSSEASLEYGGKTWRFETPRGVRTVRSKRENPVWIPPDWHYAEIAREHALGIKPLKPGKTVLSDGRWLEVRDSVVGIVDTTSGGFAPFQWARRSCSMTRSSFHRWGRSTVASA